MIFKRLLKLKNDQSFFLLGPRSTGKTFFIKNRLKDYLYIDLLEPKTYVELLANESRLEETVRAATSEWVVIDEIQRIPGLLNQVQRLISHYNTKFILTGSSARSLRKKGVNLLGGRAAINYMHPLTIQEVGKVFNLEKALQYGMLPSAITSINPKDFLKGYVTSYLREEVLQEGLTRNVGAFSHFLEVASFSQGCTLNKLSIAREVGLKRTTVSNYFDIVRDLLISFELPPFQKRAKRKIVKTPKFYFFDTGIYQILRPKGILDSPSEILGPALETLFLQSARALNDALKGEYNLYYWRTKSGFEIDVILYGQKGFFAIEIKNAEKISNKNLKGLRAFKEEYPEATLKLLYRGKTRYLTQDHIEVIPFQAFLEELPRTLNLA